MFKNIDEALNWIVGRKRNNHSFSDFKKLNEELNNPADKLRIIHVAGTNGKGSTVTMLRDFLMENGYKVGTLQSPHFLTHLDRIRINNQNIHEEIFLNKLNDTVHLFSNKSLDTYSQTLKKQFSKYEKESDPAKLSELRKSVIESHNNIISELHKILDE